MALSFMVMKTANHFIFSFTTFEISEVVYGNYRIRASCRRCINHQYRYQLWVKMVQLHHKRSFGHQFLKYLHSIAFYSHLMQTV